MKKDKKAGRLEYIIIIMVVGLINGGLIKIDNAIDTIYDLYLSELPFFIYWAVIIVMSFVTGFFYISIWAIIKKYFGDEL